jgi:hypothetical protein
MKNQMIAPANSSPSEACGDGARMARIAVAANEIVVYGPFGRNDTRDREAGNY